MIQFPNCKINLGLSITQKRGDGYHDLDTVFYPIELKDALEFVESDKLQLEITGLEIPGRIEDNIILKAYHLLKQDFPHLPALKIHLHKTIPTGGGLGGGSSNGAYMLKMMNEYFNLDLQSNNKALMKYALALGSDCPFFILNKPCHGTGRGEILDPISLNLSAYSFIFILPGIHINTGWAFSQLKPLLPLKTTKEIVLEPISTWRNALKNDFEEAIFKNHPVLKTVKEHLYQLGSIYSSMSGSGSTMFGIFQKEVLEEVKSKITEGNIFDGLKVYYID